MAASRMAGADYQAEGTSCISRIDRLEGPVSGFSDEPLHSTTERHGTDYRAISAEIEAFQNNSIDRQYRNGAFQHFSAAYNGALMSGDYELAVVWLMLMRLIRKAESAYGDADAIAETAGRIIKQAMLRQGGSS